MTYAADTGQLRGCEDNSLYLGSYRKTMYMRCNTKYDLSLYFNVCAAYTLFFLYTGIGETLAPSLEEG